MSQDGYSLSGLELELAELRKDYVAFGAAYEAVRQRILASNEIPRSPELHTWSGTRAVVGSLEMSIHSIERVILEYATLVQRVRGGELHNTDVPTRPVLSLVKEIE